MAETRSKPPTDLLPQLHFRERDRRAFDLLRPAGHSDLEMSLYHQNTGFLLIKPTTGGDNPFFFFPSAPSLAGSSSLVSCNDSAYIIASTCLLGYSLKKKRDRIRTSQLGWGSATGEAHSAVCCACLSSDPARAHFPDSPVSLRSRAGHCITFQHQ